MASRIAECLQKAADAAAFLRSDLQECYCHCEPVALEMVLSGMLATAATMQRDLARLSQEAVKQMADSPLESASDNEPNTQDHVAPSRP